jgi:DNA-binding beta-propeller fold protein YncE
MRMRMAVIGTVALVLGMVSGSRAADGPYQFIKEIQIGGEGGWDYLNVDPESKRLYVSHSTKVVVLDMATDTVVGEIADTPGVHGAVAAANGHVVTSNGRENKASIVDAKTLQTIGKVETEGNPDFIMYEPKHKEVYTFNGSGKSATVIDASGKVVATIPLGGKPEAAVPDPGAGRVYVNVEDKNTIAVIDAAKHEVVATWPIAPGEEAAGLAIDTKSHRLFIGAHKGTPGPLMVMMDSSTGTVAGQVPIGTGVDATWFDPGTGYAFSSCGDGTVTVAHEDSPDRLTVVQTLKTPRFARTMAVDPSTHRIYLAAAKYEAPEPGAPANARPKQVPGSLHLVVYGINGK